MRDMKEKLFASDPEYVPLPLNVHKVSHTPCLSTVQEENTPTLTFGTSAGHPTPMTTISGLPVKQESFVYILHLKKDFQVVKICVVAEK